MVGSILGPRCLVLSGCFGTNRGHESIPPASGMVEQLDFPEGLAVFPKRTYLPVIDLLDLFVTNGQEGKKQYTSC